MLTLYLLSSVTQQAKMLRGVIDRPSGRFRHAPSCYLLEVLVRIVKRLNHNVVLCLDSKGREVVALGLGVGFPTDGEDLDVARIDRTFYGVDERYMALFEEIPFDILEFAAQMADVVRGALSYELSPNYPLALADHIAFMVDRRRKNLAVPLPYSSEFARLYPAEWRIAAFVAERAERYFHLVLPVEETAGIAFGILGAAGAGDAGQDAPNAIESRIDDVVTSVERQLQVQIDRSGIAYARFASHLRYLLHGVRTDLETIPEHGQMLSLLEESSPVVVAVARSVARDLDAACDAEMDENEVLYLALHIGRLYGAVGGDG